jgi:phytanoyl-CoA hydroxylase
MCLDNSSRYVRKSLIYTYGHFWMKIYPSAVPRDFDRLATTPQRRQLFGVGSGAPGDYLDQSLQSPDMKKEVDTLLKSGRELFAKAKQLYYKSPK